MFGAKGPAKNKFKCTFFLCELHTNYLVSQRRTKSRLDVIKANAPLNVNWVRALSIEGL